MAKLKVYACNYNGRDGRLVAARSMRQAALLTNIPYNHFREYGHVTGNEDQCRLALSAPGVVYEGSLTNFELKWAPVKPEEKTK